MSFKKLVIAGALICLSLSACNSPQPPATQTSGAMAGKPSWILMPVPPEGGIGGVGISAKHIKGPSAQRQLAISRAIDEIAKQMGVKVTNVVQTEDHVSKSGAQSRMSAYSVQLSDGNTVIASLRAMWIDPKTEELYVWMTSR